MRSLVLLALLIGIVVVSAIPEIIYKKYKLRNWKDFECPKSGKYKYNCPGIFSRDMGNYTEVCFKTRTEWFEVNFGYGKFDGIWTQQYITKLLQYFLILNQVHLKDPLIRRSFVWVTRSRKEKDGISANYVTTRIYAPEILPGHFLRIPCEPENVLLYPKAETSLCNKTLTESFFMLKRSMVKKCFYGIHQDHNIHGYQGLQSQYKELHDNMVKDENDIFHPVSIFMPNIGAGNLKFFESKEYLKQL